MSKNLLEGLHEDFSIVDRKALEAVHRELLYFRRWQIRALKLIRRLKCRRIAK